MTTRGVRQSAAKRRERVIVEAIAVFARRGYSGASTKEIAHRAGISQPHLFRLFATKRELPTIAISRCFDETETLVTDAAQGQVGDVALDAIAAANIERLRSDPQCLLAQIHLFATSDDPEICTLTLNRYRSLVELTTTLTGLDAGSLGRFLGTGLLLNVLVALNQTSKPPAWARHLIGGCEPSLIDC